MTVDAISDLDLSYTPPLGSPWDVVQGGAQALGARGWSDWRRLGLTISEDHNRPQREGSDG